LDAAAFSEASERAICPTMVGFVPSPCTGALPVGENGCPR
jgi:hypothetical protein